MNLNSTDGEVDCSTSASVECATNDIETDTSSETTSDIQMQEEKSFPQEEKESRLTPEQLVEKYYDQLKFYQIYPLIWRDDQLVKNPCFEPVLKALTKVPPLVAERAIQAFLQWVRSAKNVDDLYSVLESAIYKKWKVNS